MIDTHCHLTHGRFSRDLDEVVGRARGAGLVAVVTIGTGVEDAEAAFRIADRFPGFVHVAAGIDPFTAHRVGDRFDDEYAALATLAAGREVVAIGECGLDYHYDLDPKAVQAERLARQLVLAVELDLPVVIHVREAHEDMARVLSEHPTARGVIHSFTAGPREAEAYLDLGWMLGFNGVATFKNAPEVRDAARITPADRIVVETDAPYLAPTPVRGKRCEPAHVALTLARLAELRGLTVEALAAATDRNARALFGLS